MVNLHTHTLIQSLGVMVLSLAVASMLDGIMTVSTVIPRLGVSDKGTIILSFILFQNDY